MSSESKRIVIELSNIRAKKYHQKDGNHNHILLGSYYEKIADLIDDRMKEIDSYKSAGFDIDNINEVKMHDAILVYGSRGNGKSTVMINLKDFITGDYSSTKTKNKLKNRVKIFETIDPTIQEEDEDFLLVILSAILKEVENHQEDRYQKRDGFYDSLENVLKIVEATRSKKKDNIDIFDKFYGLKSGVGLAEELHNLFKHTKDIFDVEILVIPIDDVDMNLKQGYQIADSIRKYMSSPYIIPIVAFNIRQMRVVTKYNKYEQFGLKIDNELESEELSFLRSLPNDYLSKVFPPNRRIYLKSVFEILQEAEIKEQPKGEKSKKISIFFKRDDDLMLKSLDMVSLISELFYETYYSRNSFKNIYSSTFLTNRSMRNFLNDCYSILLSLTANKNNYVINWRIIKDRLAPDDIYAFSTKQHALTWLWNEYIQLAKKNLVSENNTLKNYNWAKMVTETLPEDNSAEIINKKTYTRIWLQKYYRLDEKIIKKSTKKEEEREFYFEKTCDIVGAIELAMRSYIPMYLFESIVRNQNLEYNNSDLVYLKSFSSRSLQGIAYELSMMEATLYKWKGTEKFNPKPIGSVVVYNDYMASTKNKKNSKISDKEFNIPFLFKVSNQDKLVKDSSSEQVYILSIFKALALFVELIKIYKSNTKSNIEIKALIERFRVNMPDVENATEMKDEYFKDYLNKASCSPRFNKKSSRLEIEFKGSSFGILEIASFSRRLVEFFMNVRDNIGDEQLLRFSLKKEDKKNINFHLPLITYFTSFSQSLFISLFQSVKRDGILSIKTKREEDKIIFRKNSLYGTKGNPDENDHLYEKNIRNLNCIVKRNNSSNREMAKIQKDFNELFEYINKDIPFFNLLINEANFLTKLGK